MGSCYNRYDFLKQGFTICTGLALGGVNLLCCARLLKKDAIPEKVLTEEISYDFEAVGYCCYECETKCKVFKATKQNDVEAKSKIAEQWSEQLDQHIKAEDVFCRGCRVTSSPVGNGFKDMCSVRKCAVEKQVLTCAHCGEYTGCEEDLWIKWPGLRENINKIRRELQFG